METKTEPQRIGDAQQKALTELKKAGGVEHVLLSLPHTRIDGQNPILTIGGNPDGTVDYKRLAVLLFQVNLALSANPEFAETFQALERRQVKGNDAVADVSKAFGAFTQQAQAHQASYFIASMALKPDNNGKTVDYQGELSMNINPPFAAKKEFMAILKTGLQKAMKQDPEIDKIINGDDKK